MDGILGIQNWWFNKSEHCNLNRDVYCSITKQLCRLQISCEIIFWLNSVTIIIICSCEISRRVCRRILSRDIWRFDSERMVCYLILRLKLFYSCLIWISECILSLIQRSLDRFIVAHSYALLIAFCNFKVPYDRSPHPIQIVK